VAVSPNNVPSIKQAARMFAYGRRELVWVLLGQMVALLGGILGVKVLTTMLGPEGYGELALGMTMAGLLHMLIYGPIEQVVLRFVSVYRDKKQLNLFFHTLRRLHVFAGIAVFSIAIVAALFVNGYIGAEWGWLVGIAALFGIFNGLNASFISLQNALRHRRIVAFHQGLDAWLRLGLAAFALYLFRDSGYVALLGYVLGMLLIATSQIVFASRNKEISASWKLASLNQEARVQVLQQFFHYGAPFAAFAIFAAISTYGDRWIVLFLRGESEVGIYTAILQIANVPILFFVGVINQLVVPIIFERAGALSTLEQVVSSNRLLHQTGMVYVVVMLTFTGIAYFFGEELILILTTPTFAEYSDVLWVLVLGLALANIAQLLVVKGLSHNRTTLYVVPKFAQACAFLALAYLLVSAFGVTGMAWALCLSSIVYLASVVAANRTIKVPA
jgi:O-antigen/teichoic acid export membrane protein